MADAGGNSGLNWGRATLEWDGEEFDLVIPSALRGWPVAWLDLHLRERLAEIPGLEDASVSVVPALWFPSDHPTTGVDDWGEVRLRHLKPPFPDAAPLQEHLEGAIREAEARASQAKAEADRYIGTLRARRPLA